MTTNRNDRDSATKRIALWEKKGPEASFPAWLAHALVSGQSVSVIDADDDGKSRSMVSMVVTTFRAAGYDISRELHDGIPHYSVGHGPVVKAKGRVPDDAFAATHPSLGAVLTVRALSLDDDGELVAHLSNGNGSSWVATITGHVR